MDRKNCFTISMIRGTPFDSECYIRTRMTGELEFLRIYFIKTIVDSRLEMMLEQGQESSKHSISHNCENQKVLSIRPVSTITGYTPCFLQFDYDKCLSLNTMILTMVRSSYSVKEEMGSAKNPALVMVCPEDQSNIEIDRQVLRTSLLSKKTMKYTKARVIPSLVNSRLKFMKSGK